MKRSEILASFKKEFADHSEVAIMSDVILEFFEKQGMFPPQYKKRIYQPYGSGLYGLGTAWLSQEVTVSEWEPEDANR
jgi:hypothetical protein